MRILTGFILVIFITGCVLINGSINSNIVYTSSSSNIENDPGRKETCSLTDYEHLINVPNLPSIPKELKEDTVYTETALVKSIDDHRRLLKELKKELERCKSLN